MNGPLSREQLREVQGPLKERYRDEPEAALQTLAGSSDLSVSLQRA